MGGSLATLLHCLVEVEGCLNQWRGQGLIFGGGGKKGVELGG